MDTIKCPACLNFCNCTQCCVKRGVEYVSSRNVVFNMDDKSTSKLPHEKKLPKQRVALVGKSNVLPSPSLEPEVQSPASYWGTIYGLDGAKIGTTFANPVNEEQEPGVLYTAASSEPLPSQQRNVVWIGKVQSRWNSDIDLGRLDLDQRKEKTKDLRGFRWYCEPRKFIGDKSLLFCKRYVEELEGLSDLTELKGEEFCDDEEYLENGSGRCGKFLRHVHTPRL